MSSRQPLDLTMPRRVEVLPPGVGDGGQSAVASMAGLGSVSAGPSVRGTLSDSTLM